ncbi:MAG: hypothetical protein ACPHO4_02190 [Longimicrobiales bacterium]|jgi:hypothetical protein
MPRYRRIPLTREKSLQAALTSIIVGAGAAAATYVITRLMLQRDPLLPELPSGGDPLSPSADADSGADAEAP